MWSEVRRRSVLICVKSARGREVYSHCRSRSTPNARTDVMAILLLFPITWLTQGISILASFVMLLAWLLSRLAVLGSMLDFVPWLICAMVLLGVLPASIAYRQGRRFVQWWFYGTVNFAAALSKAATLTTLGSPH